MHAGHAPSPSEWTPGPPAHDPGTAWIPVPDPEPGQRRPGASIVWDVLLWTAVGLIGLLYAASIGVYFFEWVTGGDRGLLGDDAMDRWVLWVTVIIQFLMFASPPILWGIATRAGGLGGLLRYYHMERAWPDALIGVGLGVATALTAGAAIALLYYLGWLPEHLQDDGEGGGLFAAIDWPLVVAISLVAAVGEELFFRGLLQRYLGWWGQGLVFGAVHIPNGGIIPYVNSTLLGLLYGYIVHRRRSMPLVMAAHFTHNFILLSATLITTPA